MKVLLSILPLALWSQHVVAQPAFNTTFAKSFFASDHNVPIHFRAGWGDSTRWNPLPMSFLLIRSEPAFLEDTAWRTKDLTYAVNFKVLPFGFDSAWVKVTIIDPASGQSKARNMQIFGRNVPRRIHRTH